VGPFDGPDGILTGEAANDEFGRSVASAGDANGDGYADVLVSATRARSFTPSLDCRAYLFLGGQGSNWDGVPDVIFPGNSSQGCFLVLGRSGDLNRDGLADNVVGIGDRNGNSRIALYLGSASLDEVPDQVLTAVGTILQVDASADINGDGYNDFLTGVRAPDFVQSVSVYLGKVQ
jgi:hypothetical protein